MKIFLDLDGTLIDSKLRLYGLFQELVPESILTYEEYWNYKKDKINHKKILKKYFKFNDCDIKLFQTTFKNSIF